MHKFRDISDKNFLKRSLKIDHKSKIIGMIANLLPVKNHSLLLYAIPKVIKRFPDTYFILVGEGPLKNNLVELSKKLGILGKVIFLGYQKNMLKLIPAFDIGILTSKIETFGIALVEIMAFGKPVIAPNVGGIPEIVNHGVNGLLFKDESPTEIANKIINLLNNPDLTIKYGNNARTTVEERFSVGVMTDRTESILENFYNKKYEKIYY